MIKEIKSYLRPDLPKVPSAEKQPIKQPLPFALGLDYCNRFRPLFDIGSFNSEMEETKGELAEYFEPGLKNQYRSFVDSNDYVMYGSWGLSLLLAVYCHKIRLVNNIFGKNRWVMFIVRVSCLGVPYYFMDDFLEEAKVQEWKMLYSNLGTPYRRYKLSGNITELNPQIELIGEPLLQNSDPLLNQLQTKQ